MTDWLLALVPQYGVWLLAIATFSSCLALPIPASILMLTAGGFVSSGDLTLTGSIGAALAGAVAGDQTGYFGGRKGGSALIERVGAKAPPVHSAAAYLASHGGVAVFLTRWLFSALGPYVNLAAGAARQPWLHFTVWGVAGECVWVGLYVTLGYVFTGNITAASSMAGDILGIMAGGAVMVALGLWLVAAIRSDRRGDTKAS